MITIENIDKIIGMMAYGRDLVDIKEHTNSVGEASYIFVFEQDEDGQGWYKQQNMHLIRDVDSNGKYQLFIMGLGNATQVTLSKSQIQNKAVLIQEMCKCLEKAKDWWGRSNTK